MITALKNGDMRAFEYVYITYSDSLLNYADRLLNDTHTAQDVVQQVYYKIWENRTSLEITLSIRAYLYKSVYYGCLNTLTHRKNIRPYEQLQTGNLYLSHILQTPEAEISLWQSDMEEILREAIETLPEKCRKVLLLSKYEGLKNKEIAQQLGISEKTVERHITIALSKLRQHLDGALQFFIIFFFSDWG